MKYEFTSKLRTLDYWLLSMYNTYRSVVGAFNILFFFSMILISIKFWNNANDVVQVIIFLGLLVTPVFHPFGVYLKAKSQVLLTPKDGVKMVFNETGIHITVGDKNEVIRWNKVAGVSRKCGMVIIYSDPAHGYILTKRVLGAQREEFLAYLKEQLKKAIPINKR